MRRRLVAAVVALLGAQLWVLPTAGAATNPPTQICPGETTDFALAGIDDDDQRTLPRESLGTLWHRTPDAGTPSNPDSGTSAWFGKDPDPSQGDPSQSAAVAVDITPWDTLNPYGSGLLIFRHAWDFETRGGTAGHPVTYPDGGRLLVQAYDPVHRRWVDRPDIPVHNGPQQVQSGTGTPIFGGNSGGYQTSWIVFNRLLQVSRFRIAFVVTGDSTGHGTGWWVDQIEFANCSARVPSYTQASSPTQSGLSTMQVHWLPPKYVGSGIARYVVVATDGRGRTHTQVLPPTARSTVIHDLAPGPRTTYVRVAATNAYGEHGEPAYFDGDATSTSIASSSQYVKPGGQVRITGRTIRYHAAIRGMPLLLEQRHVAEGWSIVRRGYTLDSGAYSWSVPVHGLTAFRVISQGRYAWRGSISRQLVVRAR